MKYIKLFELTDNKSIVVKPPEKLPTNLKGIFLAGSIEMGKSEDWQKKVESLLKNENITIFNPRRDDWDSSWEQKIENEKFNEQVSWELNAMDQSSIIIMYLSPETKSPISLLELGLHAKSGKLMVCCPEGFWRKGNIDIVCDKYNIPMFNTIEELVHSVISKIKL